VPAVRSNARAFPIALALIAAGAQTAAISRRNSLTGGRMITTGTGWQKRFWATSW
jgi:hypothetical protein